MIKFLTIVDALAKEVDAARTTEAVTTAFDRAYTAFRTEVRKERREAEVATKRAVIKKLQAEIGE